MRFSQEELKDLLKAWIAVSLAVAIAFGAGGTTLPQRFLFSALTVGIAFLLHEMGHKFLAQKYGLLAEFKADDFLLLLALMTSFSGIVFAAPGAVVILGMTGRGEYGRIAAMGPLINLFLAVLFLAARQWLGIGGAFIGYAVTINSWLALFNLIPFGPLDGAKIFAWDKKVWGVMLVLALLLYVG